MHTDLIHEQTTRIFNKDSCLFIQRQRNFLHLIEFIVCFAVFFGYSILHITKVLFAIKNIPLRFFKSCYFSEKFYKNIKYCDIILLLKTLIAKYLREIINTFYEKKIQLKDY